jgi:hypothetical protein
LGLVSSSHVATAAGYKRTHRLDANNNNGQSDCSTLGKADGDQLRQIFQLIHGGRIMRKAIGTLIAAAAALALSGGAYAQSNNTLATPSTVSPAANSSSGYGTPGATGTDSGMGSGSSNPNSQNSATTGSTSGNTAYGANNTLATPSTASPAK